MNILPARGDVAAGWRILDVYHLFEPVDGIAHYIQAERLREAHCALADPGDLRDIHEVAEDLGFFDPLAFRREFACTPNEVRVAALSGAESAPVRRTTADATTADSPSCRGCFNEPN